jgi:hypothetical protein
LDLDSTGDVVAIGEPLLANERCAHIRDYRHPILIGEGERRQQRHAMSLGIESAHVEQPEVRAAAATRAEDPGADRQRFDVVEGKFSHADPIS